MLALAAFGQSRRCLCRSFQAAVIAGRLLPFFSVLWGESIPLRPRAEIRRLRPRLFVVGFLH